MGWMTASTQARSYVETRPATRAPHPHSLRIMFTKVLSVWASLFRLCCARAKHIAEICCIPFSASLANTAPCVLHSLSSERTPR